LKQAMELSPSRCSRLWTERKKPKILRGPAAAGSDRRLLLVAPPPRRRTWPL